MEYDGEWWVAYANGVHLETDEVSVNFLHPHRPSPSYVDPEPTDTPALYQLLAGHTLVQK